MRWTRLGWIGLSSFLFVTGGAFLKRTIIFSLCGMLTFNSATCYAHISDESQVVAAPSHNSTALATPEPVYERSSTAPKGIFDGIIRGITGGQRICLGPLCLDPGQITEALLAKQIQEFAEEHAPITISTDSLYLTIATLPGAPFDPVLLDLAGVDPKAPIPPGDYIIPVQTYCLQRSAGSPNGHRYLLGHYGGTRSEVLQAFQLAVSQDSSSYSQSEIQSTSWAIQAGVAYDDMPDEMQTMINHLIPDHRDALDKDFIQKIEEIWGIGSQILGLPSLPSFLRQKLGDAGEVIVGLINVRERVIEQGRDWRNLSREFLIESGISQEDILVTPWSQLGDGVYTRFLTEGNANDIGYLLLRLEQKQGSAGKQEPDLAIAESTKVIAAVLRLLGGVVTAYDIYDFVTALAAIPEGEDAIQPIAMVVAGEIVGEAGDRLACRGRLRVFCGGADNLARTFRPGRGMDIPNPSISRNTPHQSSPDSQNHRGGRQNNDSSHSGSPAGSPTTAASFRESTRLDGTRSSDAVNIELRHQSPNPNEYRDPYRPGSSVEEFTTTQETSFVRVHRPGNPQGRWMMRQDQIEGLTDAEIRAKFSIPGQGDLERSEIRVPAGTRVRSGEVNPIPEFGGVDANEIQYELIDGALPRGNHSPINR